MLELGQAIWEFGMRLSLVISFVAGALTLLLFGVFVPDTRKIRLPDPQIFVSDDNNSLWVQGTWRLADEEPAFPFQTTSISCDRSSKECISALAIMGTLEMLFPVEIEWLQIVQWDDNNIVLEGGHKVCTY